MSVDIRGIDKVDLLRALWKRSRWGGVYCFMDMSRKCYDEMCGGWPPHVFNEEGAATAVTQYIDRYSNRTVKVDISGDTVDTREFDQQWGDGAAAAVVSTFRQA